jgi:hypothetical protein
MCVVCGKKLCQACDKGLLCATHLAQLPPNEQLRVQQIKLNSQNRAFFIFFLTPLAMIPMIIFPFVLNDENIGLMLGLMMGLFFGIPIILFLIFISLNRKAELRRLEAEAQLRIIIQDHFGHSAQNQPPNRGDRAVHISGESKMFPAANRGPNERICPQCNSPSQDGQMRFCPYCGSEFFPLK